MAAELAADRPYGPHFLVDPADIEGDRAVLRGEDAHHLAVVLRAQTGTPVSLADGSGRVYQAHVRRAAPTRVDLGLGDAVTIPPARPRLTVVHGLPRARKLDDVVQRLSEIGVDRLVPVVTARTEVHLSGERAAKATARWRAVARAAAKQSRRARVLEVDDVGEWATAFPARTHGVVLWEQARLPLRVVLDVAAPELVLGIGPEGGLTAEEVEATGLSAASLGPTVLRTETAALVAASAVLTLAGRLG